MSLPRLYPPHPAEGRSADPFAAFRAGHGWQGAEATVVEVAELENLPLPAPAVPAADRRIHWLAYDPSARGQYPLD